MASLSDAHSVLASILGPSAEPLDVLRVADAHRSYWKPHRPRVVLLAESHVYTDASELTRYLRSGLSVPDDIPREFVRLVYCLGYGENEILDRPIGSPRNAGTPQFWKIFQSCLTPPSQDADCALLQASRTPNAMLRLAAKLAVLRALQERGVWLLDASLAALYLPGNTKPSVGLREAVLHASYDRYVAGVVESAGPEALICIGIGVARALKTRLDRSRIPWRAVHQPQAHLSAAEHQRIHRAYGAVCADPHNIEHLPLVV